MDMGSVPDVGAVTDVKGAPSPFDLKPRASEDGDVTTNVNPIHPPKEQRADDDAAFAKMTEGPAVDEAGPEAPKVPTHRWRCLDNFSRNPSEHTSSLEFQPAEPRIPASEESRRAVRWR